MLTQKEFNKLVKEYLARIEKTLLDKGHDYTNVDPVENFKLLQNYPKGIPPTVAALFEISVKHNRLKNLVLSDKIPKNESVDDTILDLACYAILMHVIRAEEEKSPTKNLNTS